MNSSITHQTILSRLVSYPIYCIVQKYYPDFVWYYLYTFRMLTKCYKARPK